MGSSGSPRQVHEVRTSPSVHSKILGQSISRPLKGSHHSPSDWMLNWPIQTGRHSCGSKVVFLDSRLVVSTRRRSPTQVWQALRRVRQSSNGLISRGRSSGVRFPEYLQVLQVAGWHLHAISTDAARGGHLLDLQVESAHVKLESAEGFEVCLPDDESFRKADLPVDVHAEVQRAERECESLGVNFTHETR